MPDECQVQFRIGLNLGDVIEDRGDIYGNGVNIAARLESLSEPGGICISEAVRNAAGANLALEYEFLGARVVKNIKEPVRAYRVLWDTARLGVPATRTPDPETPDKPSIAVLPFTNMSCDPEQEYFSDGITEDIITELSRFRELFVIARNSSFALRETPIDVSDVGKMLGVRFVVEGSVRKYGNRVRITAQLVEAGSGKHIWAQRFDRSFDDVFAVQEELSQLIAGNLVGRLEAAGAERAMQSPTKNLAAYDYLLRGVAHHHRFTRSDNEQARAMFERAISLDADYAKAYAGLAVTYLREWCWAGGASLLDRAMEIADQATELNDQETWCHAASGAVALHKGLHDKADTHLRRAVALNPNDSYVASRVGLLLIYKGRVAEALEWVDKAMRLNPYDQDRYLGFKGLALYVGRQYRESIKQLNRISVPLAWEQTWLAVADAQLDKSADEPRSRPEPSLEGPDISLLADDRLLEVEPFENKADLDHFLDGLRRAGMALR